MKLKNIIIGIFLINTLSGCAQNVALLGPAITLGTTGNVMQAGIQYGTNQAIKQETETQEIEFIALICSARHAKKSVVLEAYNDLILNCCDKLVKIAACDRIV